MRDILPATLLLLVPLSCASRAARADFSLGLVMTDTFSTPSASQADTSYSFATRSGLGGGLDAQFAIHGGLGLEVAALYVARKYSATVVALSTGVTKVDGSVYSVPAIEVPVLLTYSPSSWLSVGAGPYYAALVDHVTVTDSGTSSTQSLADSGLTGSDYGLAASVRLLIPIFGALGGRLGLLAEAQGLYGLANTAVSGSSGSNTFRYRDYQLLLGVALASF